MKKSDLQNINMPFAFMVFFGVGAVVAFFINVTLSFILAAVSGFWAFSYFQDRREEEKFKSVDPSSVADE
jgi:predicted lipid-binding transport protein (Tim44 family)